MNILFNQPVFYFLLRPLKDSWVKRELCRKLLGDPLRPTLPSYLVWHVRQSFQLGSSVGFDHFGYLFIQRCDAVGEVVREIYVDFGAQDYAF